MHAARVPAAVVAVAVAAVTKRQKVVKAALSVVRAAAVAVVHAMPRAAKLVRARKPVQTVAHAMPQTVLSALSARNVSKVLPTPKAVAAVAVAVATASRVRASVPKLTARHCCPKAKPA